MTELQPKSRNFLLRQRDHTFTRSNTKVFKGGLSEWITLTKTTLLSLKILPRKKNQNIKKRKEIRERGKEKERERRANSKKGDGWGADS